MEVTKFSMEEVLKLSLDVYNKRSTDDRYSPDERQDGLKNYFNELNKDVRENKNKIFKIIEQTADVILPTKVRDIFNQFAEYKSVGDGETIKFRVKNGKIKAHIMAVGSRAERNRVDHGFMYIKSQNIQAKVYEEYDRYISGQVDWTELMNDVIDAIMEELLKLVQVAFEGLYKKLPETNLHSSPSFDEKAFDKILSVVKSYGTPVIIGTPLALSNIPLSSNASEADKLDIRNKGYLGKYKGASVVELPQSFEDESNTVPVLDDKNIYILPSGQEKVIKVCLEGGLHADSVKGADWTMNFEVYQKGGVSILYTNNIGMYRLSEV